MSKTVRIGVSWLIALACAGYITHRVATANRASLWGTQWRTSLATQFGSKTIGDPVARGVTHDKQAGTHFACGGKLDPLAMAVAHRTLPCGSVVEVCRGRLCVFARVWDRGPFHAIKTHCAKTHGKWSQKCWVTGKTIAKVRLPGDSMYVFANDLDLLPRVAWAIRLGGKWVIRWRIIWIPGRRLRRMGR